MQHQETDLSDALAWTIETTTEAANRAADMLKSGTTLPGESRRESPVSPSGTISHYKADGTIVTEIDRAIEQFLREKITAQFPDHAILGEEYGLETRAVNAPMWAIDPIDGTVNLANGFPSWCVSVGLIVNDAPVLGVVVAPLLNEIFAGAKGLGATLNGVTLPSRAEGKALVWEDTYGICTTSARTVDFSRLPCRLRITGSSALELCYTAVGWFRGCQSIGTYLYDVAAGLCLCQEVDVVAQWLTGDLWTPQTMLPRRPKSDILITAPAQTVAFVRDNITFRE